MKNLPHSITENKLREKFAEKGQITDVQLKYKDGKFRHFAFVGFKRPNEAENARKYFDGSFIGATKVKVEFCSDLGDAEKPRAWSKYANDSSSFRKQRQSDEDQDEKGAKKKEKKAKNSEKVKEILAKYKNDEKFQEFLRIYKRNAAFNDDDEESEKNKNEDEILVEAAQNYQEENDDEEESGSKAMSDLEYLKSKTVKKEAKNVDLITLKLSNLPFKTKKKDVKAFLKPLKPQSIRVPMKISGIAFVGFKDENEAKKCLSKSKSFLKGNQVHVKKYEKVDKDNGQKGRKTYEEAEESVGESGRIFIRNLSYSITEDDIETLFKKFGPLSEVNLPVDKVTRKIKGFAFVTFILPENAAKAFSELDGKVFQGRLLHLIPAKAPVQSDESGKSFKDQKVQKLKGMSHNWNTLFLGQSQVADIMSEKYDVSKRDVVSSDKAAVRLALGETQIVAETKAFLEENGVSLDAFNRPPEKRSKTVILAKNLPANTNPEEIRDKFAKFGHLGRLVLPPFNGITAIIEFLEPSEARTAFKSLAYTKFKNTPLYLEWAPDDTFTNDFQGTSSTNEEPPSTSTSDEPNSTLFVKNLNFDTTEDSLKEHFSRIGPVDSATISAKKDPKRQGMLLSMGFGFVRFRNASDADKALKNLQHKMLDDHCLELKRSNRAAQDNEQQHQKRKRQNVDEKNESANITVKNIPFQASEREIRELFQTFGHLKAVRLPKKMTGGGHRGFGFIEYASKEEAKKAMEALSLSTHLYGRRLVLEWANQAEDLDDLRRKTADKFGGNDGEPLKRH